MEKLWTRSNPDAIGVTLAPKVGGARSNPDAIGVTLAFADGARSNPCLYILAKE